MHGRSPRFLMFVLGQFAFFILPAISWADPPPTPVTFTDRPGISLDVPAFSDTQIARLEGTLDTLLAREPGSAPWGSSARLTLWNFVRQLQGGRLTAIQEAGVQRHLAVIERAHPKDAAVVEQSRTMLSTLTVGKTAPDIAGQDLTGVPFRLSDYRGKVVVLVFSADWCGICRTLYPYERLMQDLYKNWPLAILGVETGANGPDAARRTMADEHLTHRVWWDPPGDDGVGPIATAWNVQGFPSIYVLDGAGVVRFVDLHDEDLLKGVRQLLSEQVDLEARATPR